MIRTRAIGYGPDDSGAIFMPVTRNAPSRVTPVTVEAHPADFVIQERIEALAAEFASKAALRMRAYRARKRGGGGGPDPALCESVIA